MIRNLFGRGYFAFLMLIVVVVVLHGEILNFAAIHSCTFILFAVLKVFVKN